MTTRLPTCSLDKYVARLCSVACSVCRALLPFAFTLLDSLGHERCISQSPELSEHHSVPEFASVYMMMASLSHLSQGLLTLGMVSAIDKSGHVSGSPAKCQAYSWTTQGSPEPDEAWDETPAAGRVELR
jgi:hypothetical protein